MTESSAKFYRSFYGWWIFLAFYGFLFLLSAGSALNPSLPSTGRITCAIIALGIAGFLAHSYRAGISTSGDKVTVRKYFGKSISVPWNEVETFEAIRSSGMHNGVYISIRLKNGKRLKTQGLVAQSANSNAASRYIEDLEAQRPS